MKIFWEYFKFLSKFFINLSKFSNVFDEYIFAECPPHHRNFGPFSLGPPSFFSHGTLMNCGGDTSGCLQLCAKRGVASCLRSGMECTSIRDSSVQQMSTMMKFNTRIKSEKTPAAGQIDPPAPTVTETLETLRVTLPHCK